VSTHPSASIDKTLNPGRDADVTLLFTSAGRRVSLLQEFRRAARDLGIKLRLCGADCQPMAPALQIVDEVVIVPRIDTSHCIDHLVEYCRRERVDALIPLIDPELQPLSEARRRFNEIETQLILSSAETVNICVDKVRTHEFLTQNGFKTPQILSDVELASPTFPLFIKPRIGSSSMGAHKIRNPDDLAYHRKCDPDAIVQEFIEGIEHTVDVFADFNGRPRCAVPRRRHEVRGGEVSKGQAVRHDRMMAESCRLVEALGGAIGVMTIQCFLTPAEDIVFIEINPRFGGGVPLSIAAGADSPRWILELLLGRQPEISMNGWTDGLLMLRYDQGIFIPFDQIPLP
jgi:carbamoyl-phosphate synthase large subunit